MNDERIDEQTGERQKFSSRILPVYARRSPKVGEVIPILYLRRLSTGDFRPALEGLLGEDAAGLSASTVSRLCKEWEAHHARFRRRLLSFSRYAYCFMDGIHVQVRLAFFDYPAEHWRHLRTTNPIESSFATVRLRTRVTKGPGRGPARRPPRSRWPTSCSKARRSAGAGSTATSSSPTCSTA